MHRKLVGLLTACLLALSSQSAIAADPIFPKLTGPVVDLVDEIPADREAALSEDLRAFQKTTGHQLQVVTLPDLQERELTEFSLDLARHWRLGREGVDDGILLLHSVKERKIRIEVGRGAEPYLTDALTSQIITRDIAPAFKEGRFADGMIAGAHAIMKEAAITPEQRAEDQRRERMAAERRAQEFADNTARFFFVVFLIVLGIFVIGAAWYLVTLPDRRRRSAEERAAKLEQLREWKRRKAEAEADAARVRKERAAAREKMLAAMSPAKRTAFLQAEERERQAESERQRQAEEAHRTREREEQRHRREREREKEQAAARRRQEDTQTSIPTWSSPASSSSSISNDSWSGGGGDFGGGGASGDY